MNKIPSDHGRTATNTLNQENVRSILELPRESLARFVRATTAKEPYYVAVHEQERSNHMDNISKYLDIIELFGWAGDGTR